MIDFSLWGAESDYGPLFQSLCKAHFESTFRKNPSSVIIANVADAGGSFPHALAAGLCSTGGRHADVAATFRFLFAEEGGAGRVGELLDGGAKVPGWGTSFHSGGVDPIWVPVQEEIARAHPDVALIIDGVTEVLHKRGKNIFPNPSTWTAACAHVWGIKDPKMADYLVVACRLNAWAHIWVNNQRA